MVAPIKPSSISQDMTTDTELANEASLRISGDANLQSQIDALKTYYTVNSTTTVTTTSTTPINLMTVSNPSAGTYLAIANVNTSSSNNGRTNTFSIYVGGVIVASSTGAISSNPSPDSSYNISIPVTVNGSQSVEVRWHTSANTATADIRNLTLMRLV